MVRGPAHGPRVDVVQLAACARARGALVTLAILEELLLAMSHRRRDGAVVPCRDEGWPLQNGDDLDNVDDRPLLQLIQLLRSALARLGIVRRVQVCVSPTQKKPQDASYHILLKHFKWCHGRIRDQIQVLLCPSMMGDD